MSTIDHAHHPPRRRRSRRWLIIPLALAGAVVLVLLWYSLALRPTGHGAASVTIETGESTSAIAKKLKEQQLIRSPAVFKFYVRKHKLAPQFQAGRFSLSGNKSTSEVARALTDKNSRQSRFTIKEGLTQEAIAKQLGDLKLVDRQEFADLKAKDFPQYEFLQNLPGDAPLEGFLFPETYSTPPEGTSTKDVATIMLNQFEKELTPELQQKVQASGRSLYEILIVASIAEEEVKTDEDRRLVAGIVYRRLREDIRLDADATLRYGLNKPTDAITQSDLESDNPYNTRRIKGLPPTPIASPGLAAITAALEPEESEYLFYFTGKDGKTVFSKTLEEHEANREKFQ